MQGDGVVSLLVCFSLLTGVVVGLRFNVRMLVWLCLAAIGGGTAAAIGGFFPIGHGVVMTTVAIVALQVGYFVALVIGAMRLTEEPSELRHEIVTREVVAERSRATRA